MGIKEANLQKKYLDYAICPMCGLAHSEIRYIGGIKIKGYGRMGGKEVKFWEKLDKEYDSNKSFGVRIGVGKAGWKNWKYINPEDNLKLFNLVKSIFLKAIESWLKKGWIAKKEIEKILKK